MSNGANSVGIGAVFLFPIARARMAVMQIIEEIGAIHPTHHSDGDSVASTHYPPAIANVLVSAAADSVYAKLGHHCVALTLTVDDPVGSAKRAQSIFETHGVTAVAHDHAIEDFPPGFLAFVAAPELGPIVIEFRPTDEAAKVFLDHKTAEQKAKLPVRVDLMELATAALPDVGSTLDVKA